ncbi:hypothetical protein LJ725_25445 [Reyranella aquatilis]|uniref:DUF2846 domain-containing protein n=1 Tax=Reyranella aquatilis TaxID=2035356 RepID=A0ABS8L1X8_9HYPH|nr:hypothetical protein [Reyranella aquatilis]MCC8432334.1 hypothetical protein [Reyranella aquatilis]
MRKFALLVALALAVGACQPRSAPLMATADYEQQVRRIAAPPSDRARLYIFTGKHQAHALLTTYTLHDVTADLYVDETKIGTVNPKEAMVVDIVPGRYSLHWLPLNNTEGLLLKSKRFETEFAGGTAHVLFANIEPPFGPEIAPGIVVTPTNPGPANNVIPPLFKIVRPASCPPTICLP